MTALNSLPVPGDCLCAISSFPLDHVDGGGRPLLDAPLLEEDGDVNEQLCHSAGHGECGVLGVGFTDFVVQNLIRIVIFLELHLLRACEAMRV